MSASESSCLFFFATNSRRCQTPNMAYFHCQTHSYCQMVLICQLLFVFVLLQPPTAGGMLMTTRQSLGRCELQPDCSGPVAEAGVTAQSLLSLSRSVASADLFARTLHPNRLFNQPLRLLLIGMWVLWPITEHRNSSRSFCSLAGLISDLARSICRHASS